MSDGLPDPAPAAAQRSLSSNVVANLLNAVAGIAAAALAVPLILHYVGLDGFGVWTLAQTALMYVSTAETGFGPAVQRYVSVARGANDRAMASRVIWSASFFYVVFGALIAAVVALTAPTIVDLFDVPDDLHDDAVAMFRLIGLTMLPALVAAGLANVLQGAERFAEAAVATLVTQIVFLGGSAFALASGRGLRGVGEAALAQFVIGVVLRVWMLRDVIGGHPALVTAKERKELIAFSLRMQVNVLSQLINSQTDKIVVGLIATTAVVGEVGIGSQVAEATRFLAGAALGPIIARLAIAHGAGDSERLVRLYHQLDGLWLRLGSGLVVVALAVMAPLITAWLGDEAGDAALYGVVLTFAYGINLLTGTGVAYLRAIGKPGLEARYGAIIIVANVTLTILFGVLFGPVGVVCATAVAYAAGTAWFFSQLRHQVPPAHGRIGAPRGVLILAATAAAAVTFGLGTLAAELLPRYVALIPIGLVAGAALVGYAIVAMGGVRNLRGALATS